MGHARRKHYLPPALHTSLVCSGCNDGCSSWNGQPVLSLQLSPKVVHATSISGFISEIINVLAVPMCPCLSHVQMVATRRQTSRGRANSRSASRSARSTSQRSRAPRERAGHAGQGRGGRPRVASSRRDSGGGDDHPPGLVELWEMVQDLHEQLEIRGVQFTTCSRSWTTCVRSRHPTVRPNRSIWMRRPTGRNQTWVSSTWRRPRRRPQWRRPRSGSS